MSDKHVVVRLQVLNRDKWRCVLCGREAGTVHHIAPRSAFGKKGQKQLWDERNMATLCIHCHGDMAHTKEARAELIRVMERDYGYDYEGWERWK